MDQRLSSGRTYPPYISLPCAGGGLLLAALGGVRVLGLSQGSLAARAAVLLLFLVIAAMACALVCTQKDGRGLILLLPIGLAFFLRALCLDHISLDYQDFLAHWAAFFRDNGGFLALDQPVGNYNVPYLYFLAAISYLPVPDLYLIKLFSVAFDVVLAWGGMRLVRLLSPAGSFRPALAGCLLLVLPTVVLNGSYWGQCDSVYAALLLHALADAMDRRPRRSVVLLALAFCFKLQAIFLVPLWCVFWYSGRVKFRHLFLFPLTCLVSIIPALLLGKPLGDILGIYLGQMEVNNALSFNAPSAYQLIPYGAPVDSDLAARVGIAAAFVLVLALLGALYPLRKQLDNGALLLAALILAAGVPFLLPYMHDRYFFPADALALVWACINLRRIPQAVFIQLASLSAYFTYFRMQYTLPLRLGSRIFPMGFEALLVLAMLACALFVLIRHLAVRRSGAGQTQFHSV